MLNIKIIIIIYKIIHLLIKIIISTFFIKNHTAVTLLISPQIVP